MAYPSEARAAHYPQSLGVGIGLPQTEQTAIDYAHTVFANLTTLISRLESLSDRLLGPSPTYGDVHDTLSAPIGKLALLRDQAMLAETQLKHALNVLDRLDQAL
ncbi:hypothetical protein [Brucella sp. IR073]|uniref:hypothetical protein n=1 Tax=unclassified Brucella TaxID=2632610 RepID=UPI003B9805E4